MSSSGSQNDFFPRSLETQSVALLRRLSLLGSLLTRVGRGRINATGNRKRAGDQHPPFKFSCSVWLQPLTADNGVSATSDNHLYRMATSPGVGSDLATEDATAPADGWLTYAATRHANVHCLRAATARRIDAKRLMNRWWRAAAAVSGKCAGGGYSHESHSDRSKRRKITKTNHVSLPL